MTDRRQKDAAWLLDPSTRGKYTPHDALLAVVMDLRDELKQANRQREIVGETLANLAAALQELAQVTREARQQLASIKEDVLRLRVKASESTTAVCRMERRLALHMPIKPARKKLPGRKR